MDAISIILNVTIAALAPTYYKRAEPTCHSHRFLRYFLPSQRVRCGDAAVAVAIIVDDSTIVVVVVIIVVIVDGQY